jgi:hypothetical protein
MRTLSVIIQHTSSHHITSIQLYSPNPPLPHQTINMQFLVAASLFAAALAAPVAQTTDCPNPAHCGPPHTTRTSTSATTSSAGTARISHPLTSSSPATTPRTSLAQSARPPFPARPSLAETPTGLTAATASS